jgi:4'-phosphopantetheinyl transferase
MLKTCPDPLAAYYVATAARTDEALAADAALLDPHERAKRDGLTFTDERRDYVAAHALVRRTLSRYRAVAETEWAFEVGPFGKPFIVERLIGSPPLMFNLSHTKGLVACAVGTAVELGIDVESLDHSGDDLKLAERYFAGSEVADLRARSAGERPTRFIELWVLKEAYIKAVGRGLSHPLPSFAFELTGEDGLRFTAPPGETAARWHFALFAAAERYRLAIALNGGESTASVDFALHNGGPGVSSGVLLRRSL